MLVMIFVAIVLFLLGVAIGRSLRHRKTLLPVRFTADSYHQSLRFLLNEQTDSTVDIFIQSLDVTPETLDIHLAVAGLMRRKGEITKAIAIHENLLTVTGLTIDLKQQVQLELAQNYIHAGLLDRAELLLLPLVRLRKPIAGALEQLLGIYQNEKEWQKAIDIAERLQGNSERFGVQELAQMKSHYYCELAEEHIAAGRQAEAQHYLQLAGHSHQYSFRAGLIAARLAYEAHSYTEALAIVKKLPQHDPDLTRECLPLLIACCHALGDQEGLRKSLFLILNQHKNNSTQVALSDVIAAQEGTESAVFFLEQQVSQKPSIRVLKQIIDLYLQHSDGKAKQNLELLSLIVEKVIAEKPIYLCNRCGFSAVHLHWLCPGCKTWGSVRPVKGVSGE